MRDKAPADPGGKSGSVVNVADLPITPVLFKPSTVMRLAFYSRQKSSAGSQLLAPAFILVGCPAGRRCRRDVDLDVTGFATGHHASGSQGKSELQGYP